jgi:hypothetical protein
VVAPGVVLYLATSADAVFAAVLGGAAVAAHRGLVRRSAAWTVAGGVLLWAASILTYAAALLLVFLGVRAAGRLGGERAWVLRWAASTAAVVVGLAGGLWLTTGYDVPAALLAAASWGFTKGEVERIFQFLVPLVLVPAVRQLLAWRVRVPVVVGLLVAQALLVQVLFATRW